MTKKSTHLQSPPPELADLALLEIRDICSLARVSKAWFHAEVAAGRGPVPLRFGTRCTRWRASDVRAWMTARAEAAAADINANELIKARAQRVSRAKATSRAAKARRESALEVAR